MTSIKSGVDLSMLQPQMSVATQIVAEVYHSYGCDLVITGGCEPGHSPGGLHPTGFALDYRTRNVPVGFLGSLGDKVQEALSDQFDVVEKRIPPHLHVEFDPR